MYYFQQCDKYPSAQHAPSSYRQHQRGQTFDCTEDGLGVGMNHPLTYATIACVRRDGRYSRRPPRRQNSSETILPPPPSFYSADHPLIVSSFSINSPIFKILLPLNSNYTNER